MKRNMLTLSLFLALSVSPSFADDIELKGLPENPIRNLKELDGWLAAAFPGAERQVDFDKGAGRWMAQTQEGSRVIIIADQNHDRVRVMTPISEIDAADPELLFKLLAANFGSALDARYAVNRGYLWALFLHPLSDCRPSTLQDGIRQVATLARNTGTTFASSGLVFGGGT